LAAFLRLHPRERILPVHADAAVSLAHVKPVAIICDGGLALSLSKGHCYQQKH